MKCRYSDATAHRFDGDLRNCTCTRINAPIRNLLIISGRVTPCREIVIFSAPPSPNCQLVRPRVAELHVATLKAGRLAVPYACRNDACIANNGHTRVSELSCHWDMSVTCNSIQRQLCVRTCGSARARVRVLFNSLSSFDK